MKRLTTDTPDGNFETMLNFVFGKDGWAHIRHDGEEVSVPLTQWAKAQCILHGCDEFPAETPTEIDAEICDCMLDCPDCPIALAYCFASQAVHLRGRLKMYEDILFSEDGTERLTLDDLRDLVSSRKSEQFAPGDTVWVVTRDENGNADEVSGYMFLAAVDYFAILSMFINDVEYLDETMAYLADDTAENYDTDLSVFPLADVYREKEKAEIALRREVDAP